jgi:hypothetical protein
VERYIEPWFDVVLTEPGRFEADLDSTLQEILAARLPLRELGPQVERLTKAPVQSVADTAKFMLFVIDLVAAATMPEGGKDYSERWNDAVKRVPPELRETVEERARSIIIRRRPRHEVRSPA